MPNAGYRHIAIVLDRSGSMHAVKADTEGGLKAFLAAQAEVPGPTTVSLYQFDDRFQTVYESTPLANVPPFTLHPRGMTALLDAVGRTIGMLSDPLRWPDKEPTEMVVVILTDGQENASREYSREQVKSLIAQQEKAGWRFVFLGADQDAFAAAGGIGIRSDTTLSYAGTRTQESLTAAGRMVARGTKTGIYRFTDAERGETTAH